MSATLSAEKRRRAAAFPLRPGKTPPSGALQVQYASPFDRSCFLVSAPDLSKKHKAAYDQLMQELTTETGCAESEILAHGNKVRAMLFFAEDRLARAGALAGLVGREKLAHDLPAVTPAF